MGMVPIPVISPLTLPRSDEPVLEPLPPVSRVENSPGGSSEDADGSYSPAEQEAAPDPILRDAEPQSTDKEASPTRHISYFA
jgi:hypothetical protein